MNSHEHLEAPALPRRRLFPVLEGLVCTTLVLLALPVSQWIGDLDKPLPPVVEPGPVVRPPVLPEVKKEEPKKEKPDIDKLKEEIPPLTLTQIEIALNPVLVGIGGTGTAVVLPGGSVIDDFVLPEFLTEAPRAVSQPRPVYPAECRAMGLQGEVYLMFKVRSDGTTADYEVLESDHPAFSDAAVRSVRKWRFTPGEKDGRPVTTYVKIRIPFKMH